MRKTVKEQVREMWAGLAMAPAAFPGPGGVRVVVSPESALCPAGWVGVVALDGAVLATVPEPGRGGRVRDAVRAVGADLELLPGVMPVTDVLGPATLAYLDPEAFTPGDGGAERLAADDAGVTALLDAADPGDVGESGLREITSGAFAVREGREVVAVAGYRSWPGSVAHVSVLTAAHRRGAGLARTAASAAVADALRLGLLPQWRARPEASRRVARRLGFEQVGAQISLRPAD
ncbi:GNAT family N-acetyltransferase [Nonomuraea sp. SBT364]|uniref:GNAT family N-acetyltransferase n=1 Tax=Nonomuraea sp. SBT364 TaxID=1580530 RepID=UPI00066CB723|nr:GNAT family N-acetyltransferase [Nonomuraea sp. SBT364]